MSSYALHQWSATLLPRAILAIRIFAEGCRKKLIIIYIAQAVSSGAVTARDPGLGPGQYM
jgi:hypothetical protein